MKKLAFLLVCFLSLGGWSHGRAPQTYTVSNSGNDSNNGIDLPWATPGKVNSSQFNSGDTIKFDSGSTFTAGLSLSQTNVPSNLTITSTGAGRPTFNTGNSAACVTVSYLAWLTINNLNCVGGGNLSNTTKGIAFTNVGNGVLGGPTLTNNTITGYGDSCVFINANTATSGWTAASLNLNSVHDCTGNVIPVSGIATACVSIQNGNGFGTSITFSNVTVTNNTVFNCTGVAGSSNVVGDGIALASTKVVTISNNVVHDSGQNNNASAGPVGIILFSDDQATISFNEVYHIRSATADGEGFDFDDGVTNSTLEYNYSHNNQHAEMLIGDFNGDLGNNNIIRFNVFEASNGTTGGILFTCTGGGGCTNYQIYNNTIYANGGDAVHLGTENVNTENFSATVSNNIIYQANGSAVHVRISNGTLASVTLTGNDYTGNTLNVTAQGTNYTSLASLQAACSSPTLVLEKTGGCVTAVGTTASPNLTGTAGSGGNCSDVFTTPCPNAYTLTSSSPAGKGNGLDLNTLYSYVVGTQDLYGNAVTHSTLPIGAAANK